MLKIVPSNQFKKDLKLAKKRGCKIEQLRDVVNMLACRQKLDKKYHDHELIGNYRGFRECHIESDFFLFTVLVRICWSCFCFVQGHIPICFNESFRAKCTLCMKQF